MLKIQNPLAIALLSVFIAVSSCKKDSGNPQLPDLSKDHMAVHSDDQARVSNDMDAITNDLNLALEGNQGFSGRVQQVNSLCGATAVADTMSNPRTITITYNGNNCANTHHRQGTVVLSMPAGVRWKNQGAVLTVQYNNLKIKRLADNKSITINGTKTLTNVTGGLLYHLATTNQIIHTISSNNMSITFPDSSQRNWNIARKRTYTYNNGIVITITGTHNASNVTGIAEWGTDRFGHQFVSAISQPLVIRQDCNFRLTSGQVKHHRQNATATVSFGLDATGNPTACPGAAPFYYKLEWTGPAGNTYTLIHPY